MSPINFAIIGTNWITHAYVSHAHATGKWRLAAVYSRKEETAKEFASHYEGNISLYTSLDDVAADPNVAAVYIASPNILHFAHAKQMLSAGKHVILEKPATSTLAQLDDLFAIAKSKGVVLIEAFRHVQEANFKILKKSIEDGTLGPILGASLNYCQFSSRYDSVLKGETPNVFTRKFGGGALTDLGVYTVAAAIELFGPPSSSTYYPTIIRTGADGGGTLVLKYDAFTVTLNFSKMYYSAAPSEVYGEKGTLRIPSITDIETVTFWDPRKKASMELGREKEELNMKEEAEEHARIILEKDVAAMEHWERHSKAVVKVTEGARRANGLLFPGEQ